MSMQYTAIFHGCKNDNFQMIFLNVFLIFAQNIDCGYTLEPPQRGGSNEYPQSMFWSKNKKKYEYPSKPHFFYIKVGCKGVYITQTCFHDVHCRGNTLRVSYQLCICHTLGTVFELHQSSENKQRYFRIIKKQNAYRPSYAV